jgi:hypothetical protein
MSDRQSIIKKIVPPNERILSDAMSVMEFAAIMSIRSDQIGSNNHAYVDPPAGMTKTSDIAAYELRQKKCPLMLQRVIEETPTHVVVELWSPNEMIIPWSKTSYATQ